MMNKVCITDLHNQYNTWIKDLDFYKDELKTFNSRLGELVKSNSKIEVTALIEQYQNQFIRQNEVIDILRHDISIDEQKLVQNAKANNLATEHRKVDVNDSLSERVEMFNKIYQELKGNFHRFLFKSF